MSGYLGRMWSSMVKGAAPLRPLVGSVYASRGETRRAAPFNETSFEQDNIERVGPVPPGNEPTAKAPEVSTGRDEMRSSAFTYFEYQPLLPRRSLHSFEASPAQRGSPSQDFEADENRERDTRPQDLRPRNLVEFRSQSDPVRSVTDSSAADVLHLQTGDARVEWELDRRARDAESREALLQSLEEPERQRESPAAAARQQLQSAQQRNHLPVHRGDVVAKPAEESDVEIHIGRIEVVAVQPPAPRAPSPRQSRTTSLDDYLASRSGRNR